ncbi:hypothetical protein JR316_0009644 [Psilocybe cubensis]|uniref:Protein kinase domain-containing protein n=2 Tax=Psilocybe cubensis TaxID=181762 RepID=A0A8H7XQ52_PSICU|nr:hypothetical protein JR316_0009644 [Psilocybe cubensis]KAH9477431.1 hypothetical protein JR316_0009644 [Psilocybe cubensis]
MSSGLTIPFSFEHGVEVDELERFAFWDSPDVVKWFKDHGYTLYKRSVYSGEELATFPIFPPDPQSGPVEADFPYAHHDMDTTDLPEVYQTDPPLSGVDTSGKILYAQDSLKRHVVIKLVPDNTDEYRVLRFLSEQSMDTLKENCVIPVLDLLPIEGFWLAVMPRWGIGIYQPNPRYVYEIVDIIYSRLKSLAYLHDNNISHGDIRDANVVVNHFADSRLLPRGYHRRSKLRTERRLLYALIDFDFSVMLAPDADRTKFRLPYQRFLGTNNVSNDTAAGEHDYSPFVGDVGALGVSLCFEYQCRTKYLPVLAPLLDMMTTWDLKRRFTAAEALKFFEQSLSEMTQKELEVEISGSIHYENYSTYNRWQQMHPALMEKWKVYRTPPIPWHLKTLRAIYGRSAEYNLHIIPQTRRFFAGVMSMAFKLYCKLLFWA